MTRMRLRHPPAPLQEQFFQLWEQAPDSSAYNSGFAICMEGDVDVPLLQQAACMLFDRHQVCADGLRMCISACSDSYHLACSSSTCLTICSSCRSFGHVSARLLADPRLPCSTLLR
jgi:hypothetical protein